MKFDVGMLAAIGINVNLDQYEDTLLASHAVSSSDKHGLKELGVKYLKYSDDDEKILQKQVILACNKARKLEWKLYYDSKGKRQTKADYWVPAQIDLEDSSLETYAVSDVERTILLWNLYKEFMEEEDLIEGYEKEKELLRVVRKIENCGLTINLYKTDYISSFLSQRTIQHRSKCSFVAKKVFNEELNLDSPHELANIIHGEDKFNLPIIDRTAKGNIALGKPVLLKVFAKCEQGTYEHKFLRHLLLSKAYTSGGRYLKGYKQVCFPYKVGVGILYPSLNQSGTVTTRFTSSNPNGQNVGKKSKYVVGEDEITIPKLREVFCPVKGKVWYAIDYSQIELRVFAFVSQEQSLIDALNAGYDFHGYVASRIFNCSLEEVTDQQRTIAKNVNFALIFGATEAKVDDTAGFAGAYKIFAGQFPNASTFMKEIVSKVSRTGNIRTVDGYRLDVPAHKPYKAVNYLVQGTAGRIIKRAMIDLDKVLDWDKAKMILQVHDELIFEVDADSEYNTPKFVFQLMSIMEGAGKAIGIDTPVSCDLIEDNWGMGKEIIVTENSFTLAA